jgi:aspartate ammonia-lyase
MSREDVTRLLSPARLSGLETITSAIPIITPQAEGAREPHVGLS